MTAAVESTHCLYVFGITYAADAEPVLPSNAQVEWTRVAGVAAAHHTIDATDLAGLDEDLTEHSRLAAVARAHDATVQALHEAGAVLPVRMGTVFADSDQLRHVLTRHQDELTAALDQVRGHDEWRVRLTHADAPTEPATSRPASGADYLRARRTRRDEAQQRRDALDAAWETLDGQLSAVAVGSANAGRRGTHAYLVPRTSRDTFAATATAATASIEQFGGGLTLLGPLPPYAFVDAHLGRTS